MIDLVGRVVATGAYAADGEGYDRIAAAIGDPRDCVVVGVEGTGSYGAGISRRLAELGYDVVEAVRPKRERRMAGRDKNDPADAERAARDALAGKASGAPKAGGGWVEALRFRMVARDAAVSGPARAANSAHALIVTAPAPIRGELGGMKAPALMKALSPQAQGPATSSSRRSGSPSGPLSLSWIGAKKAAAAHEEAMREILLANAPALPGIRCCGTISAARLAVTAGTTPRGRAASRCSPPFAEPPPSRPPAARSSGIA